MDVDYYKILEVNRNANYDQVRKAFLNLTKKWHPDKNPNNKKEAEAKFKLILEAYEVLSDSQKRANYDQEAGLGDLGDCTFVYRCNPCNARPLFGDMFSRSLKGDMFSNPFGDMFSRPLFRDMFSNPFGDDIFGSSSSRNGFVSEFNIMCSKPKNSNPIEYKVPCSLERLYKGATLKIEFARVMVDIFGTTMPVEVEMTMKIKPGWKKGMKISFPGNRILSGITFVIDEKPHGVFSRDGDDLVVTQKISLAEALQSYTVHLNTLDGRNLSIRITNVIHPSYEEVVPGEGMPILNDHTKRGDLRINFDIV